MILKQRGRKSFCLKLVPLAALLIYLLYVLCTYEYLKITFNGAPILE